jgi:predicted PurR-regulated permease PerM
LISKEAYINFALLLLGILGGMLWAGFLGLFIGPTVLMLLVTTIQIYQERFAKEDGRVINSYVSSSAKVGDSEEEP